MAKYLGGGIAKSFTAGPFGGRRNLLREVPPKGVSCCWSAGKPGRRKVIIVCAGEASMDIVALSAIDDGMVDLVGGKAAGLGALIRAGENVPDGVLSCHERILAWRGAARCSTSGVSTSRRRAGRCSVERVGGGSAGRELCRAARDGSRCGRRRRFDHRDSHLLAVAGHTSSSRLSGSPLASGQACGHGCGGPADAPDYSWV
jgi:hypothetical protein